MTPKEKAIELHDKYYQEFERLGLDELPNKYAKEHALICVDEVIKNKPHKIIEKYYVDSGGNKTDEKYFEMVSNEFFWQNVKSVLNAL